MRGKKTFRFNPQRVADLQEQHGLKDIEFARKAGINRQMLQQWKAGGTRPNAASLEAMAAAFGVDINYFFTGHDKQNDRQAAKV